MRFRQSTWLEGRLAMLTFAGVFFALPGSAQEVPPPNRAAIPAEVTVTVAHLATEQQVLRASEREFSRSDVLGGLAAQDPAFSRVTETLAPSSTIPAIRLRPPVVPRPRAARGFRVTPADTTLVRPIEPHPLLARRLSSPGPTAAARAGALELPPRLTTRSRT